MVHLERGTPLLPRDVDKRAALPIAPAPDVPAVPSPAPAVAAPASEPNRATIVLAGVNVLVMEDLLSQTVKLCCLLAAEKKASPEEDGTGHGQEEVNFADPAASVPATTSALKPASLLRTIR